MTEAMTRRDFVRATAGAGLAATAPAPLGAAAHTVLVRRSVAPVVVSDMSGLEFRNGGPVSCVEKAFQMITEGADVLDAVVAGVNIPELDPEESGVGYGGLPNADGVVQLDACCMHGPRRWAGGVAALEGVRTPSLVAKAVMELTDHHLLVGQGARDFARSLGFSVENDLNTERSRSLWLEWRRRVDPEHWLDPRERLQGMPEAPGMPPDLDAAGVGPPAPSAASFLRQRADRYYRAGLDMVREGLLREASFWGTVNCNAVSPRGEICGVTTTSGLAWKIPGRVGDSPILGAGLYVDGEVGAAGSTGRGEANLYNLTSFLIVEGMRRGLHPKDAGMEGLRRIRANTVEPRLLNRRGEPAFDIRFFIVNARGEYAGVAMYGSAESTFAVCTENGAEALPLDTLLEGSPRDQPG